MECTHLHLEDLTPFLLALFFQGHNMTEFIMRIDGPMDFLGDIWADPSLAFSVLLSMSHNLKKRGRRERGGGGGRRGSSKTPWDKRL